MSQPQPEQAVRKRRHWLRDWRVWLGIAISFVCVWWVGRDIPIRDVGRAMGRADLPLLLLLSVPSYVLSVLFRAFRWRHLTNPITPISRRALFRAVSIGFMVNNLVPLRVGEIVRSWYLSREVEASGTALLGTVVLERVVDIMCVLLIAVTAVAWLGAGSARTGDFRESALALALIVALILAGLFALRTAPDRLIGLVRLLTRPLPERFGLFLEESLRKFADGLGALRGGSHLLWIIFHSAMIWLVFSTLPVLAGVLAFDLDLGPPYETLVTSWILLAAVGVAVAIPSAPGFFGPYQVAFVVVLERFGVDPATALALGLLVWFVFWATLTVQGLIVVRVRNTPLAELTRPSE